MRCNVVLLMAGICDGTMQIWRESLHRCNRIHVPLDGKAYYRDTDGNKLLDTGEAYLLVNSFARNFTLIPENRYYHLYLDFQTLPPLTSRDVQSLDLANDPLSRALLDAVTAIIRENDPENCRIRSENAEAFAQISGILEVLMRHLQLRYSLHVVKNPKIASAIQYIEEHYSEPLRNEDLAAQLHIDAKYLIRLFRRYMDMPPHQYLSQCRIEHAMTELHSGKSVADTAFACGYQSEAAFRIAFKRITGYSPTTIRKSESKS
ncbi:MAG: helix-turn-helix transcriptional regulator [Clostridia bacterium]|nr:helix-turn-helix transcriptional regulator [Clostridia bacterium]